MSKLTFFPPPLWVTVRNLTKYLIKRNRQKFLRKMGTHTIAKTMRQWKNYLKCLTHNIHPHTPKQSSPPRPRQRPGGSALCLQAKAKRLPGNPAQQPVGIIRVGWHLASRGPQRWPWSQPTMTTALLLQQISNVFLSLCHTYTLQLTFFRNTQPKADRYWQMPKINTTDSVIILSNGLCKWSINAHLT